MDLERIIEQLGDLRADMMVEVELQAAALQKVHADFRESAKNLLHYLVLRRRDLRPLQSELAELGLSSLGRAESHVLATVDAVLDALHRLAAKPLRPLDARGFDFAAGERLLAEHTESLLGPARPGRGVRIMVTMPSEAAEDFTLVHGLLASGMDCMRINCAHDDTAAWARMIAHLRRAEAMIGRSCRIVMDLAGPKLRTGPVEAGPRVLRIRPSRDAEGSVTAPARVWLTDAATPPSPADATLPVPRGWLRCLEVGARIELTDARGSKRELNVIDVAPGGCWAEAAQTLYVKTGTVLSHAQAGAENAERHTRIGPLPATETPLHLEQGDLLVLTRDTVPGRPATRDRAGRVLTPAMIGCTIPEVLGSVRSGEAVWFDDGRIGGVIEKVEEARVLVRITRARWKGEKLRADKGINLPESELDLPALTMQDLEDLAFVAAHADVVELSFANTVDDVLALQRHLARLGEGQPAIVLKIETARGFANLPEMLLAAMRAPCCGVMIARGDLAVECGFERLAEVQEEILWISEAAHVPVIWATQVLESLAKEGMPSRAEITDAAMGHRAECVMLNKGPHVVAAVEVLDDILRRMQDHQSKKRSMMRELRLAHRLHGPVPVGSREAPSRLPTKPL